VEAWLCSYVRNDDEFITIRCERKQMRTPLDRLLEHKCCTPDRGNSTERGLSTVRNKRKSGQMDVKLLAEKRSP